MVEWGSESNGGNGRRLDFPRFSSSASLSLIVSSLGLSVGSSRSPTLVVLLFVVVLLVLGFVVLSVIGGSLKMRALALAYSVSLSSSVLSSFDLSPPSDAKDTLFGFAVGLRIISNF